MLHHNAPAHTWLLVSEFLATYETIVIPQPHYSPDLAPFVPEVEIHSERSPISDHRRDRRKFATGPTRYPANCVPELEIKLEAVYRQWGGVL
jgi:hypothetical protein